MIEQIAGTTFQSLIPTGDKVEIGDKDSVDFKPHLKLNRWDGECFIKVGLPVTEKSLPIIDGDKITWEGIDRHILMYPFASKQFELGAYEYEVVLEKKPKSNKIVLDFNTQGLRLCYQAPLTQKDIEEGCHRPENIVGSYAVYHATKGGMVDSRGKDYLCGKAFHITRPKIYDARGDWVWGELYYDGLHLITTVPQEFLEYAHYPIRQVAGAEFGYAGEGGSDYGTPNFLYTYPYACGEAGTATSIKAYCYAGATGGSWHWVIYDATDRIAYTDESSGGDEGGFARKWHSLNIAAGGDLGVQTYNMGFYTERSSTYLNLSYDDDEADNPEFENVTYQYPPPATWTPTTSASTRKLSIVCTYTPAVVGWANIASLRQGTGEIASADIANIRMGTGSIAVADIAEIPVGVAV